MKRNLFLAALAMCLLTFSTVSAEAVTVSKVLFVGNVSGFGQYAPRPAAPFSTLEPCNIYIEAADFITQPQKDNKNAFDVDLGVDVIIRLPQSGRKIAEMNDAETFKTTLHSDINAQFFAIALDFEGWRPGAYRVEVGVRDNLAGQVASGDLQFELREPTEEEIANYNQRSAPQQ